MGKKEIALQKIAAIKNATIVGENTAERVGEAMEAMMAAHDDLVTKEDFAELADEVIGGTAISPISPLGTIDNIFLAVARGGGYSGDSSYAVDVFAIQQGKSYEITIPNGGGKSGIYALAYTDWAEVKAQSYYSDEHVIEIADSVGAGTNYTYTIDSALNYPCLLVCYKKAGGTPTVKTEQTTEPTVVKVTPQTFTSAQKQKARTNIGAASEPQLDALAAQLVETQTITYDDSSSGIFSGYYRVDETPPRKVVGNYGFRGISFPIQAGDFVVTNTSEPGTLAAGHVLIDANGNMTKIVPTNGTFNITQQMIDGGAVALGVSFRDSLTPNISIVITRTNTLSGRVASLEVAAQKNTPMKSLPVNNAYKGVAAAAIKNKLLAMDADVNILLLGDSQTAFTNVGSVFDNAANLPAGCQRNCITFQLWDMLCKNKPQCDRFDSSVNPFTESGTWVLSDVTKQNTSVNSGAEKGEYSPDNCVYREASSTGASVAFSWNLSNYEKLNFIHRISAYDGTTEVSISCTSQKAEVYDRDTDSWVEANGYTFSQHKEAGLRSNCEADWVRNVPLRMRRKSGATGSITLTFRNSGTGTMYYWGTERYNWNTVRVTNIGRGGRHIQLLQGNMDSELAYRDVDLIILQLPMWNEMKNGGDYNGTWDSRHIAFLNYLKTKSSNFADFQVIVNLYHLQSNDWDGNKNLQFQANGISTRPKTNLPSWQGEMKTLAALKGFDAAVPVCNLVGEVYNYALAKGITMKQILTGNGNMGSETEVDESATGDYFTVDGVHCSPLGFKFYSLCIAPMLYD